MLLLSITDTNLLSPCNRQASMCTVLSYCHLVVIKNKKQTLKARVHHFLSNCSLPGALNFGCTLKSTENFKNADALIPSPEIFI